MRRIIPLFFVAVVVWLSGCENLDRELVTDITGQQLIKSYDYTLNRLNSLYTNIPAGYLQIDGAMTASATDEAEHTLETSNVQNSITAPGMPSITPIICGLTFIWAFGKRINFWYQQIALI